MVFENNGIKQILQENYNEKLYSMFVTEKPDSITLLQFSEIVKQKNEMLILEPPAKV
jgi:hypothetical protein